MNSKTKPDIIIPSIFHDSGNIIAGMSTRLGKDVKAPYHNNLSFYAGDEPQNVKLNRDNFFTSLGIARNRLAIPQQVHSAHIRIANDPGFYRDTDALITNQKNLFLSISTADCFPVMLYDKKNEVIANVHSGWRGTQKEIVKKTIEMMQKEFNSLQNDILVWIGPGISSEHFEVGKEVTEMFDEDYVTEKEGKFYIDLQSVILKQLEDSGRLSNQIETAGFCTYTESDYLHSYRRDKNLSGRMFSVIGMKD